MRTTSLVPILALLAVGACTEVHQTEACIGTRYGKIVEPRMSTGINLTVFEQANCFPLTDMNFPSADAETEGSPKGADKFTMDATTRDPMTVSGDISIVYAFDPAMIDSVFIEKRSQDAAEAQIANAIRDGYQAAISGWTVIDLTGANRPALGDSIRAHIQTKLATRYGHLATIKQVYVRGLHMPPAIEEARITSTKQEITLHTAQQQLAIDSMNARGQIIKAQAVAETNRLTSLSYASNPKMLDLEIAKALSGLCGSATTCVIGASPNALLGLRGQ